MEFQLHHFIIAVGAILLFAWGISRAEVINGRHERDAYPNLEDKHE